MPAAADAGRGGVKFPAAPPPEVSAYFAEKSLRPAFRWTEVWGQEHAHAFTVAKATQIDVLQAIRESLQTAIDKGVPYEAWSKTLKPELETRGWWGVREMTDPATGEVRPVQLGSARRLQTIYDANLRTARAAGQWERAQRTKAVLPYFVYELGPSQHHREEHVAREGFVASVDDPVWNSWYPPNGWGCKCWLRQITRTKAEEIGLGDAAALDRGEREFTRTRDDGSIQTVKVPRGIDPGWASNPGKARAENLAKALADKAAALPPDLAKAIGAGPAVTAAEAAAKPATPTPAPTPVPAAEEPPAPRPPAAPAQPPVTSQPAEPAPAEIEAARAAAVVATTRETIAHLWANGGAEAVINNTPAGERHSVPVAVAPEALRDLLGASAVLVMTGAAEALAHVEKHRNDAHGMELADYRHVQAILDGFELVKTYAHPPSAVFVGEVDGKGWEVVAKATGEGSELWTSSLFPLTPATLGRQRKKVARLKDAGGGSHSPHGT